MSEQTSISALRRKIAAKRPKPEMSRMSAQNALRQATVREAQKLGGLVAVVAELIQKRMIVSGLVDSLPDPAMILLLNGPEGAVGLAVMDAQFIAGVIEHITTGRVVPGLAEVRNPTQTDAIITADFIDCILAGFDRNLQSVPDAPPVSGFRYSTVLEGPRAVMLALPEIPYRSFQMTVDFAAGPKTGSISFVFPWYRANVELLGKQNSRNWQAVLHSSVSKAEVSLEAILYRFSISLSDVVNWDAGTVVPVPVSPLAAVDLIGSNGRKVSGAKLGQSTGMRAVRLQVSPEQNASLTGESEFVGSGPTPLQDAINISEQAVHQDLDTSTSTLNNQDAENALL